MPNLYANKRIRMVHNIVKYIVRQLPPKSQIKVQTGEQVTPAQIIAQGQLNGGFRTINLSALLQTSPQEAKNYLQKAIGQKIFKGELLAFKGATILQPKKVITSPTDGVLDSFDVNSGQLRMSFIPKIIDIPAALYGIVEDIDQVSGKVVIKSEVSEVFGLLGSGKVRDGVLHIIDKRGNLTRADQIKDEYLGGILVSGGLVYKEAFSAAISIGVHGLVSGGINAKDYVSMSGGQLSFPRKNNTDVGVSVVACEGFGSIPLGQDFFDLFEAYEGKFTIIDGNRAKIILPSFDESCMIRIIKTALTKRVGFDVEPLPQLQAVELNVGAIVRIIAPPFMGEQGKVVSVDSSPTVLSSEIVTYMVAIETLTRKITVPYPNIEVI